MSRSAIEETLRVVDRILKGEELSATDLVREGKVQAKSARDRLNKICECITAIKKEKKGRAFKYSLRADNESAGATRSYRALLATRTILERYKDTLIGSTIEQLIQSQLPKVQPELRSLEAARVFYSKTAMSAIHIAEGRNVDILVKSIYERCEVRFAYANFHGVLYEVQLAPWTLIFGDQGLYVYGLCTDSTKDTHLKQRRLYNLSRITGLHLTDELFIYPSSEQYSPREYFKHCFGIFLPPEDMEPELVKLKFSPRWKEYVNVNPFHECQRSVEVNEKTGCAEVTLEIYVTYDVVRWIRGHGKDIEVLHPPELAEWVNSGEGAENKRSNTDS